MNRFLPTGLAALVVVILLAKAVSSAMTLKDVPEFEFTGPGEYRFTIDQPDHYTVWHNSTASINGVYTVNDAKLPPGTTITLEHAGAQVPVKAHGGHYQSGSDSGSSTSILSFNAAERGEYVLKMSGFEGTRAFRISPGLGIMPVFTVMGWFMAVIPAGLIFLALLTLALLKKFPRPAAGNAPSPTAPVR